MQKTFFHKNSIFIELLLWNSLTNYNLTFHRDDNIFRNRPYTEIVILSGFLEISQLYVKIKNIYTDCRWS